jgi:hypothetical protein
MKATVAIPWRPTPSRMKPYECVRRFWAQHFPDWPVITADSDTEIFSLSQARNNAVRQVTTDVVVLCDADTIPPAESVLIAVADPVGITWPHEIWRLIPPEYADRRFEDFPKAPPLVNYADGLGGCIVVTTQEYWRLGGMPEEFQGWGYEDKAFHAVAVTLSTFRRIGGVAYSIEHNTKLRAADSPGWSRDPYRNRAQFRPYEKAAGKPELMAEWLRIRYEDIPEQPRDWRSRAGIYLEPARRELTSPPLRRKVSQATGWRERWRA